MCTLGLRTAPFVFECLNARLQGVLHFLPLFDDGTHFGAGIGKDLVGILQQRISFLLGFVQQLIRAPLGQWP